MSNASRAVDIAVFGEYGLYGAAMPNRSYTEPYAYELPSSQQRICACTDAQWRRRSPVLAKISCMARKHKSYLVVDLAERAVCGAVGVPPVQRACRVGGDAVFLNAQVVVDRRGVLVAVYRKSHLYFEPNFDQPLVPDVVWFDTDFGVRFASLICFDIMFQEPATSLLQMGISAFVYSTWWVNEAPLINGVQTQAAFARRFNVTLLAAGIGLNNQISGSGIYVGERTVASTYNPSSLVSRNRLLVASIDSPTNAIVAPAPPSSSVGVPVSRKRLTNFAIVPFAPLNTTSVQAAQVGVQCAFQYLAATSSRANEQFALVALDGMYNGLFPLSLCAVVRCGINSCLEFTLETYTSFTAWQLNAIVSPTQNITWLEMTMGADGVQLSNVTYGDKMIAGQSSDSILGATLWGLQW